MSTWDCIRPRLCLFVVALICIAGCTTSSSAGLIGWWKLSDGSGATAADSSPSGTTGQVANHDTGGLGDGGSVWVDDAQRGTVISFDGTAEGAYVSAGSVPQMTLDNNFTWAFWANQDADNADNNIILGNRMDVTLVDFDSRQFIKFTPTKFEWHMNGNGDDNLDYDDIPAGEWLHHAVVKDGASLTYYRNGVESAAGTFTQPLDFPQPLFMGGDNQNAEGENWRGMLSDARIYDSALSASEVAALVPEPASILLALAGLLIIGANVATRRNRR
jgi:hypothetical protein